MKDKTTDNSRSLKVIKGLNLSRTGFALRAGLSTSLTLTIVIGLKNISIPEMEYVSACGKEEASEPVMLFAIAKM
jgi:hypothetical protein